MKTFLTQFFARTILVFVSIFLFAALMVESKAQGCTTPQVFNVSGGCIDEPINLSGSEVGVVYHLLRIIPGEFIQQEISTIQGTGQGISFSAPFTIGLYVVFATKSCYTGSVNMNGEINISPHIQVFNATGGCEDMPINLSGSQVGVTYHLLTYDGTANIDVAQLQGTGEPLSFNPPFIVGRPYFIVAENDCDPAGVSMNGLLTAVPRPQVFDLTGGCFGSSLILSGSQVGVTYGLLMFNSFSAQYDQVAQLQGTGQSLSFTPTSNPGPYLVVATNACTNPFNTVMNGNISLSNPPQVFNVTGGGCASNPINLSGSEIGITYHLINSVNFQQGAQLQGTGGPLSFNGPHSPGIYNIIATNSCKPLGVVMNGAVSSGSTQTFYRDADGDGYGDPNTTTQSCTQPGGYVSNNTDCNDNNNTINPATRWVLDADGDGYYIGDIITQCVLPGTGYVRLYNITIIVFGFIFEVPNELPGDCNDHDPTMHSKYPFYPDDDGDGYGNFRSLVTQMVCAVNANTPPAGYSLNNSDCNDDDPTAWQSSGLVYIDKDGDGYDDGNGQSIICIGSSLPVGYSYTTNGIDCNDNDPTIHAKYSFYPDGDGDGYGDFRSLVAQMVCAVDANTPPHGYSLNNSDCNDNDPTVWRSSGLVYIDNDGDGYDSGNGQPIICIGASLPAGYSYTSNGIDCNDNDPAMHSEFTFYVDVDGDGFGAANAKGFPRCALNANTPPAGYSSNNSDCNDNKNTVYPGAPDICDGLDNDCDNLVDENAITYYQDNDQDGLGNAANSIQACKQLEGYVTNSGDCDDTNPDLRGWFPFYRDNDKDGFGGSFSKQFEVCAFDANTPPDGYSTNNSDCDDANNKIYPGAAEICNGIDDNCNGTIDEQACICQNATNLSTTNISCNSATLRWVAFINPTQWELEYKSTSNGSKWINVPVPIASTRSVNITGLKPNQNYQWHIRAKCGKAWTLFSDLVLFKTLTTCTTSADITGSASIAKPEEEISKLSENMKVMAMPNPSNTYFRINLNSHNLKDPIKLIITDMLGRVIETRTTNAGQIVTIGERYRNGTYMVRIIQGKETRQLKLIKLPD